MIRQLKFLLVALIVGALSGCTTLPPGSDFSKDASSAFAHPEKTSLGRQFDKMAQGHSGDSGFRIIPAGANGFLIRMQMINAAERTLDLQYYIFRGDDTGRLLTSAVLRAADRGVRVRILIDDGDTEPGDEQIMTLAAQRSIEVRLFNPFTYRGHVELFRAVEFMFNASRLDYRMHNKLFVIDNAVALIGGRNIGDQYFQVEPESQFADDDLFCAGPIVKKLSTTFDLFWNSALSIPAQALSGSRLSKAALDENREALDEHKQEMKTEGINYVKQIAVGEPFNGIISKRLPLVWAPAKLVYDSPEKKRVEDGEMVGRLMHRPVAITAMAVHSELLMITPFFIPGVEGMRILDELRQRNVRVRILTNSLDSTPQLLAHSGYMHYRKPLLEKGVELYEIRSLLGNAKGSGESNRMSSYGNYALHAKLFVFDRQKIFIGSMNFDQRSMYLNTEVGLIIDSPEFANQIAARFDAMAQPANAYVLGLRSDGADGSPQLIWHTQEDGKPFDYEIEPARSEWQRMGADFLSLLPLDQEL